MFDALHTPIYNQHLELAPQWYRDKPGALDLDLPQLKLPSAIRQAALGAFEEAFGRVQGLMAKVSLLSDPMEVAMLSDGLHQISARLCRARLALLLARAISPRVWICARGALIGRRGAGRLSHNPSGTHPNQVKCRGVIHHALFETPTKKSTEPSSSESRGRDESRPYISVVQV